jgi:O-methyltransferase involved in polyketide biosynthesis
MEPKIREELSAVSETMLMTLYMRALESRRPDALIRDPRAEAMIERIDYDFSHFRIDAEDQAGACLRLRQFDRFTQAFLEAHPDGVVVHIGCGLDTRFDRVDNGQVTWYDLDLPPVIDLRRKLIPETSRCHFIARSALDLVWLDDVSAHVGQPFLFIAEGVFMYFEETQMRRLVLALRERFPGAELVFDICSPLIVRLQNIQLAIKRADFRMRWSLRHYDALEQWAAGIRLLEAWLYTSLEERVPRMQRVQTLFRLIPPLGRGMAIVRYRLGASNKESFPSSR